MKKQTLLILALGAGALLLLSMKAKAKRGYTIDVPEPEKITEKEFYQPTQKESPGLFERIAPIVKSIATKAKERRAARKSARQVGFPDLF